MRVSTVRRFCRFGALSLLATPVVAAQARSVVRGSLETGAAAVEQPLVRTGAAVYVAPSAQLSIRNFTLGGGAVLATGTPTWRSLLGSGFLRTPAVGNIRLLGTAQALKTSGLVPTWHGDAAAEWSGVRAAASSALRVGIGQLRYAGNWYPDASAAGSLGWSRGEFAVSVDAEAMQARRPAALQQQLGTTGVGTGAYTARALDVTPRMIWERSRLRADASVALRAVEGGFAGTRVGPQLAFTLQTARGVSLFAGAAQRLPDPRAGLPSGRSALFGVRVEGHRALIRMPIRDASLPALLIERGNLVVDAGSTQAGRVALRGDFTKWEARECRPRGIRQFDCGPMPAAGTWRVSIRINDGSWRQPANLAPAADDFGSVDGVLMTGGKP